MPPDLAVRLGPVELKNPIVCASGEWTGSPGGLRAAIDAGAAAAVAKSTNESEAAKRQLASAEYLLLDHEWRALADGAAPRFASLFNRSGLVEERFDRWVDTLVSADAYARERDAYVVASLVPAGREELVRMARDLERAGVRWLEVNVGASHGEEAPPGAIELARDPERVEEIVTRVRDAVSIPLTVKLPGHGDVVAMAAAAREGGADSVCLAGRPLGFLPDVETRRPLLGTFGAVGGGWALPLTLRWIAKARRRFGEELPLLATGGIRSGLDAARALLAGATAVQIGSAIWIEGFGALTRALDELRAYLERQGASARDLVGEAADAVMSYEEAGVGRRA